MSDQRASPVGRFDDALRSHRTTFSACVSDDSPYREIGARPHGSYVPFVRYEVQKCRSAFDAHRWERVQFLFPFVKRHVDPFAFVGRADSEPDQMTANIWTAIDEGNIDLTFAF